VEWQATSDLAGRFIRHPDCAKRSADRNAVSIEQAAQKLNLTRKKSGNQLRACPACSNEDERILAITPARGLSYCFDAKAGGDCIGLVQHITGLDVQDAAAYLSPHTREEPTAPSAPRRKRRKKAFLIRQRSRPSSLLKTA
jgi:DNA primase